MEARNNQNVRSLNFKPAGWAEHEHPFDGKKSVLPTNGVTVTPQNVYVCFKHGLQ